MATAFAIFCADDGSLTFYKRDTVPSVGDEFEGKVVGAVYEGFETKSYTSTTIPWYNEMASITSVSFVDVIAPRNMSSWFRNANQMLSFNASNLDTSNTMNMDNTFYGCSGLTSLDLSSFSTNSVTSVGGLFYYCTNLTNLDLSNFNTEKIKNMSQMFRGCTSLTTIYVSDLWSVSAVTNSSYMFAYCTSLVGAIPFDSTVTDATHANYQTGYLTYKFYADYLKNRFVIDGAELNRLADAIRDKTGTLAGLSFPDGFIAAIESISVVATDDENGNVVMSIAGLSSTNSNGDVVIK